MTREDFITQMADVLQTDAELNMETVLADLDEWDSLSMMAVMAFMNKNFGISLKIADLKGFSTIGEIAAKAGL